MEQETFRLDPDFLLADCAAAADRVRRELEGVVSAAATERRVFLDWFVNRLRLSQRGEAEERIWIELRSASGKRESATIHTVPG